ncbi:MAG: hypothetical protein EBT28_08485 [Betaproteobacteria bacterium]|nr:hypothetical protein [Betaproteobacteria bacterium]
MIDSLLYQGQLPSIQVVFGDMRLTLEWLGWLLRPNWLNLLLRPDWPDLQLRLDFQDLPQLYLTNIQLFLNQSQCL